MADETSTPATQPAPRMVSRIWTAGLAVLRWRVVGLMLVLTWARLLFGPELVASWIQATAATLVRWVEAVGVDGLLALGRSIRVGL